MTEEDLQAAIRKVNETQAAETIEARANRYELTLFAIKNCTLTGVDFGDWVQAAVDDALNGLHPECYQCGTFVHVGPCVG